MTCLTTIDHYDYRLFIDHHDVSVTEATGIEKFSAKMDKRWIVEIVTDNVVSEPEADSSDIHLKAILDHLEEFEVWCLIAAFHSEEESNCSQGMPLEVTCSNRLQYTDTYTRPATRPLSLSFTRERSSVKTLRKLRKSYR